MPGFSTRAKRGTYPCYLLKGFNVSNLSGPILERYFGEAMTTTQQVDLVIASAIQSNKPAPKVSSRYSTPTKPPARTPNELLSIMPETQHLAKRAVDLGYYGKRLDSVSR